MKKIVLLFFIIIIAIAAWCIVGSDTNFSENKKPLYINTDASFNMVMDSLEQENLIKLPFIFKYVAKIIGYDKNIKPGKYVFKNGTSLYRIVKMLKAGNQTPVNFIVTKLRTKQDLAKKIAANFECDSTSFDTYINSNDSLIKYGLDTNTVMTAIIPNTYDILWTTTPSKIFKKLFAAQQNFWTTQRKQKATTLNLSTQEVYILASIVEEETTKAADKGKIASVYLNRKNAGQKLAADPTVKYAMRSFALKRMYDKYLLYPSPYNTYIHTGLPPGPICTPSIKTIDAVLDQPATNYFYFVAKPDFSGLSNFATTFAEHLENAKNYQHFLNSVHIK